MPLRELVREAGLFYVSGVTADMSSRRMGVVNIEIGETVKSARRRA